MFGCKICIQAGTYQYYLNCWRKRRLIYIYIKNNANSLTKVSVEQLNSENITSIYNDIVLRDG